MKILLTNDDGYKAVGINTLFDTLSKKFTVTMVAPDRERSSCGHAISLTKALRLTDLGSNKYNCSGFPADCILMSVGHLLKDNKPDLIVSGPNHGANLGQDRFYSGTIAAAREACFRGHKAIAVSVVQLDPKEDFDFKLANEYIEKLISNGVNEIIPKGAILNINVPNIAKSELEGIAIAKSGHQVYTEDVLERSDFRGKSYYWIGGKYDGYQDIPGSDCNIVFSKRISVEIQYVGSDADRVDEELLKRTINCL